MEYGPLDSKRKFVASGHVLHHYIFGLDACGPEGLFGAGYEGVDDLGVPPGMHYGNAQVRAFGGGIGSATVLLGGWGRLAACRRAFELRRGLLVKPLNSK